MTEPEPRKPRTWIGKWVSDENWWRDVASQATGGVVVAAIVTLAVAASGVIPWLSVGRVFFDIVAVVALVIVLIVWAYLTGKVFRRGDRFAKWGKAGFALYVVIILLGFSLVYGGALIGVVALTTWASGWK